MKLKIFTVLSVLISVLIFFGGISASAAIAPGSRGSQVTAMQKKLIALGYLKDTADGSYGPATKAAVKSFEKANGLTADGKADDTMLSLLSIRYDSAPRITITASSLNVRKGAGSKYAKLGAVKKGKTYIVLSQKTVSGSKWYGFMYGTRVGWVSSEYVELIDESEMKITHPEGSAASLLADEILSSMTTEEKAGQLLLPCTKNLSEEELRNVTSECNIGGIVLFKKDFENKTPQQIIDMISAYQNAGDGRLLHRQRSLCRSDFRWLRSALHATRCCHFIQQSAGSCEKRYHF